MVTVHTGTGCCPRHARVSARACAFLCLTLFNTRTIYSSPSSDSLSHRFYPLFHLLLFFYTFSLSPLPWKKKTNSAGNLGGLHTRMHLKTRVMHELWFPFHSQNTVRSSLYSLPMQSITYSPLASQISPKCVHTFPFTFNWRCTESRLVKCKEQDLSALSIWSCFQPDLHVRV